jgi:hypothetical protein
VTGADGAPVVGADVVVTHTPSGTVSVSRTGASGSYFASGLRVGGPYTIVVGAPGFEGRELGGITLSAGNPETVNVSLASIQDVIVVTGERIETIGLNNGAGSSFSLSDITNQPASNRDLMRTLLRDPLANSTGATGNLSIAGQNPRFNALVIDGVQQTDDFGLSTSTYPTNRSPISLDAVEAASVVASDYSVLATGFQGGLVNVTTKSGTNEFHGAAYYYGANEDFVGDSIDGRAVNFGSFDEEEMGISLGGPILRDRLFFFGSYEEFENSRPASFVGVDASRGITDGDQFFSVLNDIILSETGYDAGGRPSSTSLPETSERILGKVDWNINQDHRASFTYQNYEEGSVSTDAGSFQSAWYALTNVLEAYSGQVYSDWTDNLSTTIRISTKTLDKGQACNAGAGVGAIEVVLDNGDFASGPGAALDPFVDGSVFTERTFIAGCDRFRHANAFNDQRDQFHASANYIWNDHVFTVGADYEKYDLYNLFVSAGSTRGRFVYEAETGTGGGIDALVNDTATVTLAGPGAGGGLAAEWGYEKLALYVQDEWQAMPNLTVNGGIRYETFIQDDEPSFRQTFFDTYGRSNQDNLDGRDIIQPRIGVRYEPFDRTTITGGVGLFAGGDPLVWVSNAFSQLAFVATDRLTGVDPTVIPQSLVDELAANDPSTVSSFIDVIDPDFEIPSQWRASVRLEQGFDLAFPDLGFSLGPDYLFSAQYVFSDNRYGHRWRNLAATDLGYTLGVAPDGRPIYPNLQSLGQNNAIELTNSEGGETHVWSVQLAKQFESGFGFDVSYANTDAESVTVGGSSRAVSNYLGTFAFDRENPQVGRAQYETEHKFSGVFSYEDQIFGDLTSRLDVFGVITSGAPISYTFDIQNGGSATNVLFGRPGNSEGPFDNDLIYIPDPAGDPAVVYRSTFNQAAFFDLLEQRGIATGGILEPNTDESPWNQRWDLRFQQELPFANLGMSRFDGNRLKFVVDIQNFPNMLNDEWGQDYNPISFQTYALASADLVSAADVTALGVDAAPALVGDAPRTTCTTEASCLYRFNSFRNVSTGAADDADSVYRVRLGIRYEW